MDQKQRGRKAALRRVVLANSIVVFGSGQEPPLLLVSTSDNDETPATYLKALTLVQRLRLKNLWTIIMTVFLVTGPLFRSNASERKKTESLA